ncbi:hypothetical protein [Streptomyces clavifer]|uniref:hypothetical protein n=1 Tax=Streptomyces clavifer TaxID=68188 RepID=UPI0033E68694
MWLFRAEAEFAYAAADIVLDEGERARVEAFWFERDRARYVVAHHALRVVLAAVLDRCRAFLRFCGNPCPGGW